MRKARVYRNGKPAGVLIEERRDKYVFRYDAGYLADNEAPAVSLTLPKSSRPYESTHLFPFFFNMLSEGANKALQCRHLRIDENDSFGLLMATAHCDTIGAVTVKPFEQ
ncbi:MAG: HipA N-terminal domain-containing protein [Tannerellaceae bacterium]|jgi:serine/threonine-protein kinase HipA|nr:HipA N-terminal domain-containing protein [Tannerellaceae bacterium]